MMLEKIQTDLKTAMIAKEITKRDILRYIVSQIKNKQIELQKEPTDDVIIKIIKKEVKQIDEVIENLTEWTDERNTENEKKEVLWVYLPEMISEQKLKEIVATKVAELWIEDPKQNRWPLIWAIMWEHGTSVDGSMLNTIINTL